MEIMVLIYVKRTKQRNFFSRAIRLSGINSKSLWMLLLACHCYIHAARFSSPFIKGDLAIRRIFSLVDMITKP